MKRNEDETKRRFRGFREVWEVKGVGKLTDQ